MCPRLCPQQTGHRYIALDTGDLRERAGQLSWEQGRSLIVSLLTHGTHVLGHTPGHITMMNYLERLGHWEESANCCSARCSLIISTSDNSWSVVSHYDRMTGGERIKFTPRRSSIDLIHIFTYYIYVHIKTKDTREQQRKYLKL